MRFRRAILKWESMKKQIGEEDEGREFVLVLSDEILYYLFK